jgi:hypothetical protein
MLLEIFSFIKAMNSSLVIFSTKPPNQYESNYQIPIFISQFNYLDALCAYSNIVSFGIILDLLFDESSSSLHSIAIESLVSLFKTN